MKRRPVVQLAAACCGILVVGLAAGASALTPIGVIVHDPEGYANQQVTVVGTVTQQSVGYLGEGLYTILGDGRRITVLSRHGAPAPGERLQVTGKVGVLPPGDEEVEVPPLLVESGRQPAE